MVEMAWFGGGVAAFWLAVTRGRGATRRRKDGFSDLAAGPVVVNDLRGGAVAGLGCE